MDDLITRYHATSSLHYAWLQSADLTAQRQGRVYVLHDRGSNEQEALNAVRSLAHPALNIFAIRGPVQIGDEAYAWLEDTSDPSSPNSHMPATYQDMILFWGKLVRKIILLDKDLFQPYPFHGGYLALGIGEGGTIILSSILSSLVFSRSVAINPGELRTGPDEIASLLVKPRSPLLPGSSLISALASIENKDSFIAQSLQCEANPPQNGREARDLLVSFQSPAVYREYEMGCTPSEQCLGDIKEWMGDWE